MKTCLTVFVVDDDAAVRESLVWLIESAGLTARAYATAQEFLDSYDRNLAGCLVLDVRMPNMSGHVLERVLAERNARVPIVFISGHPEVWTAAGEQPGGVDCLEKPFTDDALLGRIRRAIEADLGRHAQNAA